MTDLITIHVPSDTVDPIADFYDVGSVVVDDIPQCRVQFPDRAIVFRGEHIPTQRVPGAGS